MRASERLCCCLMIAAVGHGTMRPAAGAEESAGQRIEGIVLNYLGGGIAEAVVRAESLDADADAPPLAEARTNNFGDIDLRLPEPVDGPIRVRIRAEGYTEHVVEVDPTRDDLPPFIDVTLEGAARLLGTVYRKADGLPIPGATVSCRNEGRHLEATTDDDGRFELTGVSRGSAALTVTAETFGTERIQFMIEDDENETEIEMYPERPVELTVVTNLGDPAEGVLIEGYVAPHQHQVITTTDTDGRAVLRGIHPGATEIRMRLNGEKYVRMHGYNEVLELQTPEVRPSDDGAETPDGGPPPTGEASAEPDEPAVAEPVRHRLMVIVAAGIRGTVTDAESGGPIVGVRVISGRELRYDIPASWTGLDGKYELPGLPPGTNIISFQHNGYATHIEEVSLERGEITTLDARLDTGRPLAGRVVDADGQPLDQVQVSVARWKGYQTVGMGMVTRSDGRFTFPHAPAGEMEMLFVRPGYGPPKRETLAGGREDYEITLEGAEEPATPVDLDLEDRIAVGEEVPDLTLVATDGTTYRLSELRGRYVFIDIWAAWCRPCIAEMPHLRALQAAFGDRPDFLLLGISLDRDRSQFNSAVERHELTWPQVFGPKSGAQEAFEAFDGFALPYTCLIGPDGRLLAQRLRGAAIVDEVRRLMRD